MVHTCDPGTQRLRGEDCGSLSGKHNVLVSSQAIYLLSFPYVLSARLSLLFTCITNSIFTAECSRGQLAFSSAVVTAVRALSGFSDLILQCLYSLSCAATDVFAQLA